MLKFLLLQTPSLVKLTVLYRVSMSRMRMRRFVTLYVQYRGLSMSMDTTSFAVIVVYLTVQHVEGIALYVLCLIEWLRHSRSLCSETAKNLLSLTSPRAAPSL